jgi:hypothetical protein
MRKVHFRLVGDVWIEGIIHGFTDSCAIVENLATSELNLVPVDPAKLKFMGTLDEFVKAQQEAQARMQAQQVMANPMGMRPPGR